MVNKILQKISLSVLTGNEHSTSRIQSYLILAPIILMVLFFLGTEIAIIVATPMIKYHISSEIMVIFGMLLSHHLALVFSRRSSQSIKEISDNKSQDTELPK